MRCIRFLAILGALGLAACQPTPSPLPPDYKIVASLPTDIKVLQGTAVTAFKEIKVDSAGTDPASGDPIPLPANVALGIGALDAGITAAFPAGAAGRPPFTARLQIDVAATVARGSHPVGITGAAAGVAAKNETPHIVRVYGPMDGGAYIEISPTEVALSPGGTIIVKATVTRIPPFAGNVTITYPGAGTALPAGVRVAGQTQFTVALGPANPTAISQFILVAGETAQGFSFPAAEVRTGPPGPGAKTDTAAHVVSVR